jgi:plasmid stability protein
MASLLIRDLDDQVKQRLRVRAAKKGVSMEAEARNILSAAIAEPEPISGEEWVRRFREHVEAVGGFDDMIALIPDRKADALIPTSRRIPFAGDPEFDTPVDDA